MEELIARLEEALDVEGLESGTVLTDLEDWDSLAALSVIAMVSSKYGVSLGARDLKGLLTVENLHGAIFNKKN